MNIRQMSLIFLKNAVQDYAQGYVQLPQSDVQTLKNSILQGIKYINFSANSKLFRKYVNSNFKIDNILFS